jgi:ubiquinone/menaquinone biosynthesis C-methylase UbiE
MHKQAYSKEIAVRILDLCNPKSILEAGVGEATTLSGVLKHLDPGVASYGFDLSWSRVAFARKWLQNNGIEKTLLCTGDLFHIPFLDNCIDVVYTSHSIEPNGGNEVQILQELYRVTRKYLILLEPGYELASDEAKRRMDFHGYCRNLKRNSVSLGYDVLEHELFPYIANPLNPTAITIIRKDHDTELSANMLACPAFKAH